MNFSTLEISNNRPCVPLGRVVCMRPINVFKLLINFRQAIETVYSDYLGRGSHPWVYLSLEMPGESIDVNVHPTKLEVHFLHDEKIIARIQKEFDSQLAPSSDQGSEILQ